MSTQSLTTDAALPRELRAVLRIFNSDSELLAKALPHIDMDRQSISWKTIWANDFGGGHSAASSESLVRPRGNEVRPI